MVGMFMVPCMQNRFAHVLFLATEVLYLIWRLLFRLKSTEVKEYCPHKFSKVVILFISNLKLTQTRILKSDCQVMPSTMIYCMGVKLWPAGQSWPAVQFHLALEAISN